MRCLALLLVPGAAVATLSLVASPHVALAQDAAPPASTSAPAPALPTAGCAKDVDCKGERICVQGTCVDPSAKPPTTTPGAGPTATPPAPSTGTPAPPPAPSATTFGPAPQPPAPSSTESTWTPRGTAGSRGEAVAPTAWQRVGLKGIEVSIRGGAMVPNSSSPVQAPGLYPAVNGDAVGDILRGKENPFGLEPFGIVVSVGYRFFPWLSAGISFSYAEFSALDGTDTGDYADTTSQLVRQMWTLGAYGRYYFTQFHSRLHPWVELGLSYADDNASYDRAAVQTVPNPAAGPPPSNVELEAYYLEEKGLDVRVTAGLDWRLAPIFSVGPFLGYERVIPLSGCVEVDVDQWSPVKGVNTCGGSSIEAGGYGVFSGGIFAKLTFNPWAR